MWLNRLLVVSVVFLLSRFGVAGALNSETIHTEIDVVSLDRVQTAVASAAEWNLLVEPDLLRDLGLDVPTVADCSPLQEAQFRGVSVELSQVFFSNLRNQLVDAYPMSTALAFQDVQFGPQIDRTDDWQSVVAFFTPPVVSVAMAVSGEGPPLHVQSDWIEESRSEPIFIQAGEGDPLADSSVEESPETSDLARSIYRYSEAFAPEIQIATSSVGSQMLSREYPVLAESEMMGWRLTYGLPLGLADHWKTLQWINWGGENSAPLPVNVSLLSNNAVRMLGWMAGSPVNEKKAILFGQVAAGWKLGGSSHVIYLSTDAKPQQLAPTEGAEHARYFAWVNVDPGFQWVQVETLDGSERGVVFAPAVEGTATELDLTTVHSHSVITGEIELARSRKNSVEHIQDTSVWLSGLDSVHTQVVDADEDEDAWQDSGSGEVHQKRGYFQLEDFATFGNYPVYIDTKGPSLVSYVQRYRAMPWNMENLVFTRVANQKIYDWQDAHRPMTSASQGTAGVIVASFINMVQANSNVLLVPRTKMLSALDSAGNQLVPTTYSIRANGSLESPKQLVQYEERVLSLGVSKGVGVLQLLEAAEHPGEEPIEVFSEAIPMGPGVAYIMGPE